MRKNNNVNFKNIDKQTVDGFGDEWSRFNQEKLGEAQRKEIFDDYFSIFPWDRLPRGAVGVDVGCGSGRWALEVAPRVGKLHAVDASAKALEVAKRNLIGFDNVSFYNASVNDMPIEDKSLDFAYSLGVLHHLPDTENAIASIAVKLKSGAPILLYLYYSFDNRPQWYRMIWKLSELGRGIVSNLPHPLRYNASQIIAALVYWPLARTALFLKICGIKSSTWPLDYYKDKTFYVMRTDALDRFGTKLEKRFSRKEIQKMLENGGFERVHFSDHTPFWCVVGYKVGD